MVLLTRNLFLCTLLLAIVGIVLAIIAIIIAATTSTSSFQAVSTTALPSTPQASMDLAPAIADLYQKLTQTQMILNATQLDLNATKTALVAAQAELLQTQANLTIVQENLTIVQASIESLQNDAASSAAALSSAQAQLAATMELANQTQAGLAVQQSILSVAPSGEVFITSQNGSFFVTDATTHYVGATTSNWNVTSLRVNVGDYVFISWIAFDTVNQVAANNFSTILRPGPAFSPGGNATFRITAPGLNYFVAATKNYQLTVFAVGIGANQTAIVGTSVVPVGGIIMWSGSTSSFPDGYVLCNGQAVNGVTTPNLSGRFIVSIGTGPDGTGYGLGNSGGNNHLILTPDQMPAHTHATSGIPPSNPVTVVAGTNCASAGPTGALCVGYTWLLAAGAGAGPNAYTNTLTTNQAGANVAFDNRPSYYALAYLMRVY